MRSIAGKRVTGFHSTRVEHLSKSEESRHRKRNKRLETDLKVVEARAQARRCIRRQGVDRGRLPAGPGDHAGYSML